MKRLNRRDSRPRGSFRDPAGRQAAELWRCSQAAIPSLIENALPGGEPADLHAQRENLVGGLGTAVKDLHEMIPVAAALPANLPVKLPQYRFFFFS